MKNLNDVISSVDEVLNNAKLSNFEDVFSRTKTYAEKATKKSAETLEASRKMIDFIDSKTKLAKAYEKFGKIQFSAYEGNEINDDEVNSSIEEITMLKSRIEMLSQEIETMKAEAAAAFSPENRREARRSARHKKDDIQTDAVEVVEVEDNSQQD